MKIQSLPDERQALQRFIHDLVAFSSMPKIWLAYGRRDIAISLADLLLDTLSVDIVYITLKNLPCEEIIEIIRINKWSGMANHSPEISRALAPYLNQDIEPPRAIPHPIGPGMLQVELTPIGPQRKYGVLLTGSHRPDFPAEMERVLLEVGTDQLFYALGQVVLARQLRRSEQKRAGISESASSEIQESGGKARHLTRLCWVRWRPILLS